MPMVVMMLMIMMMMGMVIEITMMVVMVTMMMTITMMRIVMVLEEMMLIMMMMMVLMVMLMKTMIAMMLMMMMMRILMTMMMTLMMMMMGMLMMMLMIMVGIMMVMLMVIAVRHGLCFLFLCFAHTHDGAVLGLATRLDTNGDIRGWTEQKTTRTLTWISRLAMKRWLHIQKRKSSPSPSQSSSSSSIASLAQPVSQSSWNLVSMDNTLLCLFRLLLSMSLSRLSGFSLAMKHWLDIHENDWTDVFAKTMVHISEQQKQALGVFCTCTAGQPVMHGPWQGPTGSIDYVSEYSDGIWHWLERREWFRMHLSVDTSHGEIVFEDCELMYHGTEWGSAMQIIQGSKGFIVGPGTHAVRGKSWSGCWCVPTLGDALGRASPDRYKVDGEYSRFSCPVVLEIRAASLRKVPGTTTMHCVPAAIGTSHPGLLITGIHFNTRFMKNYIKLEDENIRRALRLDPFRCRRCACDICGHYCLAGDSGWWGWKASTKKKWYTPRCYERVTSIKCSYW